MIHRWGECEGEEYREGQEGSWGSGLGIWAGGGALCWEAVAGSQNSPSLVCSWLWLHMFVVWSCKGPSGTTCSPRLLQVALAL